MGDDDNVDPDMTRVFRGQHPLESRTESINGLPPLSLFSAQFALL